MGLELALAAVGFVFTMQQQAAARKRQKKLQQEAEKRADAAKGFTLNVEGEASPIGIPYGRNKIGGIRVYHHSSSTYTYAAPSSDTTDYKVFSQGLGGSQSGTKHEFLYVQQALCMGGINDIVEVTIDDKLVNDSEFAFGVRLHAYKDGGVSDPLIVANSPVSDNRDNAKFSNFAYVTGVFKLNRDDPQYAGVPYLQFFIEGLKVKTIIGPVGNRTLSGSKVYSNNPALCLLDYLTNPIYGRGLDAQEIDLDSFYQAYQLCERVVKTDASNSGRFWTAKGGTTHSIKLYECNVTLSPKDSIRTNVETLLETMGLAELVWSAGRYKLSLFYPEVYNNADTYLYGDIVEYSENGEYDYYKCSVASRVGVLPSTLDGWTKDVIAAYITDDDLIRGKDSTIAWPNAQERLNFATVRYLNESKDFTEDTASWPTKTGVVYQDYLIQDNNIPLETEFFEAGCSTYTQALAKAEQRVRVSRSATVYKFTVSVKHTNIEPGDLLKLSSEVLSIFGEILRVEEIKVNEDTTVDITAYKFDPRVLAWNATDDQIVDERNVYEREISQARNLTATPVNMYMGAGSGTLLWDEALDARVSEYIVKYTYDAISTISDLTIWTEIGRTTSTYYNIPELIGGNVTFAVVAAASKRIAPRSGWPILATSIYNENANTLMLYRRGATTPNTPVGVAYDFDKLDLVSIPSGWSITPPAGSSQLYYSKGLAKLESREIDTYLEWAYPSPLYPKDLDIVELTKYLVVIPKKFDGTYTYSSTYDGSIFVVDDAVDVLQDAGTVVELVSSVNCTVLLETAGLNKGKYQVTAISNDVGGAAFKITRGANISYRYLYVHALLKRPEPVTNLLLTEDFLLISNTPASKLNISYTASPDAQMYKIYYSKDNNYWVEAFTTTSTTAELFNIPIGLLYVKVVVIALNRESVEVKATIEIKGKTAPPSDVLGLSISGNTITWTPIPDIDLLGYELRYHPGTNFSWGTATKLHEGVITNFPYTLPFALADIYTLLIKAIDTSGNYSANAAYLANDFGERLVSNVVIIQDEKTKPWTGDKVSCSVSSGNLVADSAGVWWNVNDATDFWNANPTTLFWISEYKEMSYSFYLEVTPDMVGASLFLEAEIQGSTYQVFYKEDTSPVFWNAADTTLIWNTADYTKLWTNFNNLIGKQVWPGTLLLKQDAVYICEIVVAQSTQQGTIVQLKAIVDVADLIEDLENVSISATTGTRLPITKTFAEITKVYLTLRNNGGTAISAQIIDKLETGPLIKCFDANNNVVAGSVDATVQGYFV